MKLLQILQKPQRRGAEVFAYQLSQTLRRKGVEVRIVYLYPHNKPGALPIGADDVVLTEPDQSIFEVIPSVQPAKFHKLLKIIDTFQPDVVQVNGGRTVKYGALAHLFRRNQPWTLVYRNIGHPKDWVQGPFRSLFYRHVLMPNVGGIVGVSKTTLGVANDFYGLSIPAQYIPRAVDPTVLQPSRDAQTVRAQLGACSTDPVVLYVGSLSHEKRLDRLLRITQQAHKACPNLRLWIVGDGGMRPTLEATVKAMQLEECVHFCGVQENVADFINAADVLALTSDTEGIPGVVLEAGFLGRAVIATNVGGVHECVKHGETALLIEPNHEDEFATSLVGLLQDRERRQAMGEAARHWITQNFSMDQISQQYLSFYKQFMHVQHNGA
ncbi:glycosyltransferase [bacterium]|nr:glycosyltransferase [bacterium]